jgi:hypothetical protein
MPISALLESQTFRDWFNKTNEIITALDDTTLSDGVVANGSFTANGSLRVVNTWKANSSLVLHSGPTRLDGNVTITSNANTVIISPERLTVAPLDGSLFNSNVVVNASAVIVGPINANANVDIIGTLTGTSALFNGTLTSNAGPFIARQVLLASDNTTINVAWTSTINDLDTSGLNECAVLQIHDPAIIIGPTPAFITITGIKAPTGIGSSGTRALIIQNFASIPLTLVSGNTSSTAPNRFSLPNTQNIDILPGSSLELVYNVLAARWHVLVPPSVYTGIVVVWAGASLPLGFVSCDGTSLLKTSYPSLFDTIGSTFGGNSTHFATPTISNLGTSLRYIIKT